MQDFVDKIDGRAGIFSFDILPDGSYSEIRMIAINAQFKLFFEGKPNYPPFKPGVYYGNYFKNPNFESFCYKCAVTRETLYSYVNTYGIWLSGFYIPVDSDSENTRYCCYILKVTREIDADEASKRSAKISLDVLNMNIKLHKNRDLIKGISEVAGDINKICGSEKCSIVLVDKNEKKCSFINDTGEHDEYMKKIAGDMNCTPYEMSEIWERALAGTDCLLLDNLNSVKEHNELWYQSLCKREIKSIVLFAIRFNKQLVGFIWSANFNVGDMIRIKETLEITAFFMGALIANHQLLKKLEVLSMYDVLTEVRNRNAMNKRVDQFNNGETPLPEKMGIVFADLNGLKTVNDCEGHEAGDRLLKKSASILRNAFGEYEIYRAGGDEFVIFCLDIDQEVLSECIAKLKMLSENTEDVRFAVGSGLFTGEYDINRSMQIADERMYRDKEEYYRMHPEKKRRGTA